MEELTKMAEVFDEREAKEAWEACCAKDFERYRGLDSAQREAVVNAARTMLQTRSEIASLAPDGSGKKAPAGKQSIIEGEAWKLALEQGKLVQREVEAVMRNAGEGEPASSTSDDSFLSGQEQGSGRWFQLRASRLTASAFGNAIGFWRGGRNELWEEKLGLREGFAGNEATEWGSKTEDEAVAVYEAFSRKKVSHLLFHLLSSDEAELWIGASPDGLIGTNSAVEVDPLTGASEPGGVLEIKCPFNKGDPLHAKPYAKVPWYYIPQVQGLLAVFDKPWCDLVSYTVNGGVAIYRVERDHEYWAVMYSCLSDFWWQNVVPGKHALAAGGDVEKYRPSAEHPMCQELKRRSRVIADASQTTWLAPDRVASLRESMRRDES